MKYDKEKMMSMVKEICSTVENSVEGRRTEKKFKKFFELFFEFCDEGDNVGAYQMLSLVQDLVREEGGDKTMEAYKDFVSEFLADLGWVEFVYPLFGKIVGERVSVEEYITPIIRRMWQDSGKREGFPTFLANKIQEEVCPYRVIERGVLIV